MFEPSRPRQVSFAATVSAALVAAAATLFAPSTAKPCSPAPCTGSSFSLDQADVPANLESFRWEPRVDRSPEGDTPLEELDVKVLDKETGDAVPLSAERVTREEIHVDFQETLVPGRAYRFVAENDCERASDTHESSFVATTEADRPASPPLPVADPLRVGDQTIVAFGGSCGYPTRDIEAGIRRVRTPHTQQMRPWVDVWETTAQVRRVGADEFRNWNPPSTIQRPSAERSDVIETTLVTACEKPEDGYVVSSLDPGRYDVRFRVSLPATDWSIHSDAVTVDLRCSKTNPDDVGPDHEVGPFSDVGPDSGPGTNHTDIGTGPGWSEENGSERGAGSCGGCSSADSQPLSPALVVFAVLGLVVRRSRGSSE